MSKVTSASTGIMFRYGFVRASWQCYGRLLPAALLVGLILHLWWTDMSYVRPAANSFSDHFLGSVSSQWHSKAPEPEFHLNAHRLATPDDFRPHFEAVMAMPRLTMDQTKATCTWRPGEQVNYQYGENSWWVQDELPHHVLSSRRQSWHMHIKTGLVPWSMAKDSFSGRGIVVLAGHGNTTPRVKFLLKLLVALGSTLPVEVFYWDKEMNSTDFDEIAQIHPNVFVTDLSRAEDSLFYTDGPTEFTTGFLMKTTAVLRTRFAELLLIDSDNLPTFAPDALFESETYREYGTVFWPDIARTRPNNPMWTITNTPCKMDEWEQESGQLLVDKRRFFYHLQLAAWFNHQTFYNGFLLGDKDMFRFAWHALKTPYGRPSRFVTAVGTRTTELDLNGIAFCGRSFAQHHPDANNASVAFLHANDMKRMNPAALEHFRARDGVFAWYQRAPHDQEPLHLSRATIQLEDWEYLENMPDEWHNTCSLIDNSETRDASEIIPGFDDLFKSIGGYDMLEHTVNS